MAFCKQEVIKILYFIHYFCVKLSWTYQPIMAWCVRQDMPTGISEKHCPYLKIIKLANVYASKLWNKQIPTAYFPAHTSKKNWTENEIERNLKQNFYDFIRILDYCNLVVEGKWTFPTKKLWKLKEALSFKNFLYNREIHNLVLSYIRHNFFSHLYSYLKYRGSLLNLYFGTKIFTKWVKLLRTLGLYWKIELEQKVSLIIVLINMNFSVPKPKLHWSEIRVRRY